MDPLPVQYLTLLPELICNRRPRILIQLVDQRQKLRVVVAYIRLYIASALLQIQRFLQ